VPVEDEMKQIISWSKSNKLSINLAKYKEMVFWRPGLKSEFMPSLLPDVVRVTCCKLLGTFVDCNLNFSQQVDQVVKVCSQIYYLLQQMRKQGLDVGCLQVVLHKARRYGFTSTLHCSEELQADDKLFSGTVCSNHCLHHLLQPDRSLFPRGYSFDLPRFNMT